MGLSFENMAAFIGRAEEGLLALEVEATSALERVGNEIVSVAQSLAPIGSGDEDVPGELRDSIHAVVGVNQVDIHVDAPYAVHVEYGDSKMAAEPFFQPALAQAKL